MGTSFCHGAREKLQGFTLIEMIAVMAIMAILAGSIAPSIISQIVRAKADQETITLKTLLKSLKLYSLDNKTVPTQSGTSWATAVASMHSLPVSKVISNENGHTRGYYVDPRFLTGTETVFTGYSQTTGLSAQPVSPRIMLVSNMDADALPAPTTTAAFSAIWDQSVGASVIESESIRIERINLQPYFHRVILNNEHTTNQPSYQLESGISHSIDLKSGSTVGSASLFVFDSTKVNLIADPFPGGALERAFIVKSDDNYLYEFNGLNYNWVQP